MTSEIRVLIADDHLIVREGLRMILANYPEITLVGEAENGLQAVEMVAETQPHVVLMDLRMPGLDGLAAIVKIREQWPDVAVVILTTYDEDELMVRGLQAGAKSFLLKDTGRQTLIDTIQAAARGDMLLQSDTFERLLKISAVELPSAKAEAETRSRITLSRRELEVLQLVANGARNKEIALQLNISQSTVKAHLDSIFNKLGVDSRTAAVTIAVHDGLLAN